VSTVEPGLRPLERAVRRHAEAGMPTTEIAWRFRRSPRHIQRVLDLCEVPREESSPRAPDPDGLRAIERCVVTARRHGIDYPEIAARLRRSPAFVARVEMLANYKLRGGKDDNR
jgi:hypothetical protein